MTRYFAHTLVCLFIFHFNYGMALDINDAKSDVSQTYIKVILVKENRKPALVGEKAAGVRFEYYINGQLEKRLGKRDFNFCEIDDQKRELGNTGLITLKQVGVGVGGTVVTAFLGGLGLFGTAGGAGAGTPFFIAGAAVGAGTVAKIGFLQTQKNQQQGEADTLGEDAVGGKDVQSNISVSEYAEKMDSALSKVKSSTNWMANCDKRIFISADRISPRSAETTSRATGSK
ncbi:MAG: hypothetical protein AB7F59_00690 [Bdellovibrionales bacterium]